jgi:aspartyl-tRNA(Asn)/glutamyl-tRNA(Gln) amidotransferase subunit A
MPVESETRDIAERAARTFQELGAIVEDAAPTIDDPQWILDLSFGANAAGQHSRRPDVEKQQMDPALVAYAEAIGTTPLSDLVKAVIGRQTVVRQLSDFFERYDLLLTPTVGLPAFPIGIVGPTEVAGQKVTHLGWSATYIFNWSGQPAMSVPAGWTKDGLPVGLQIVGRRLDDALVVAAGAAFEAARPWADRWPALDDLAH